MKIKPKALLFLLLVAPLPAYSFPFIMAGSGFAILPFILSCITALTKKRSRIVGMTLLSLLIYQVTTPDFKEISGVQEKDDNRLSYMISNQHMIESHIIGGNTSTEAISYNDALQAHLPMIFVNGGGNQNLPGVSLVDLATNARYVKKSSVIISNDKYLSANAAHITGLRYVPETINDVFKASNTKQSIESPDCSQKTCTNVALIEGYYFLFSGYPYKRFDDSITTDSLLINERKGLQRLLELSNGGGNALRLEYFGDDDSDKFISGITNFLANNGLKNFKVASYVEIDKNTDTYEKLSKSLFETNNLIPFNEIGYLCKDDAVLISTFDDDYEKTTLLTNYVLKRCHIENLPIVGMTAHEAISYIRQRAKTLNPKKRYIGIYSDKPSAFYTGIAIEQLNSMGISAIGKSPISVDAEAKYGLDQAYGLKRVADQSINFAYSHIIGLDQRLDMLQLVIALSFIFGISLFIFLKSKNLWEIQASWFSNIALMCALQYFYFYFPTPQGFDPIDAALVIVSVQFAITLIWEKFFKENHLSKLKGIKWLKKNGFPTLPFVEIKSATTTEYEFACEKFNHDVIFRSNSSVENMNQKLSGEFDSPVVKGELNYPSFLSAWALMEKSTGNASFFAQPHINFEYSGVIRSFFTESGHRQIHLEFSPHAHGITGAKAAPYEEKLISHHSAPFSNELILEQFYEVTEKLGENAIAEFGIYQGKLYWTQLMSISEHSAFSVNAGRFSESGFNQEVKLATPIFASFLNKFLPWTQHIVSDGKILEKHGAIFNAFRLLSFMVSIDFLYRASKTLFIKNAQNTKPNKLLLRAVFAINQIAKLKKQSRVCKFDIDPEIWKLLNSCDSPYSNFPAITRKEFAVSNDRIKIKQRKSFITMELCRFLISQQMSLISSEILRSAKINGFDESEIKRLDMNDFKKGYIYIGSDNVTPESSDDSYLTKGIRQETGSLFNYDSKNHNDFEKLILNQSSAVVIMKAPDVKVFDFHNHISTLVIPEKIPKNSHFTQRALAFGISVKIKGCDAIIGKNQAGN